MDKNLSRRNFLKYLAGGAAAAVPAGALLLSCRRAAAPSADAVVHST